MSVARIDHTATRLTNGTVLVAGGNIAGTVYLASAELYDPANGTWTSTGPLRAARTQHTATLLMDGTVLVAGGWGSGGMTPTAELYDPATGDWTLLSTQMTTARYLHTATLLRNGKVLVGGGLYSVSTAELFDPVSRTWAATGSMNNGRYVYTATLLLDGNVLVAGGDNNTGSYSALYTTEQYVPTAAALTPPHFNTNLRLTPDGFQMQLDGVLATNSVVVYASTNCLNWLPILTNGPATGSVSFMDRAATNWPRRFYKAGER
jgi:N-acetylneuraminic acid mutarotase